MGIEETGQDNTGQEAQGQEEVTLDSQNQGDETSGTGINPAWNELLETLPSSLHSQVTPHLSKWDQNFQSKINEVHSQYEPYKPFIENEVNPEQIQYALGVLNAIEENPQQVFEALRAYIGEEDEQGQGDPEDNGQGSDETPEWMNHPEFQRMSEMVNTMAGLLVQQREQETNSQIDSELDQEFSAAQQTHGDFDEEWVLTKMLNNPDLSVDEAVQEYKKFEQSIASRYAKPGPPVLSGGGSVPNPSPGPGMEGKDRRAYIQQMLAQANQQNQ